METERNSEESEPPLEALREQARAAVEHSSYRHVARQAGISPETLRQFVVERSTPYGRTLDRLKGLFLRDVPQVPYGSYGAAAAPQGSAPFAGRSYPTGRRARQPRPSFPRGPDAEHVAMRLQSARRAFESDAELADFLGVDRAQPARWRAGQVPDPANRERLVALDVVIELLSGYLSPSSIPKWLHGVNAHLGDRRPIAVLREGSLSEVIAAIEAEKSGAFA